MLLLPTEPPPKGPPTYNTTNSKPVNGLSPRAYPDKLIQKKKNEEYTRYQILLAWCLPSSFKVRDYLYWWLPAGIWRRFLSSTLFFESIDLACDQQAWWPSTQKSDEAPPPLQTSEISSNPNMVFGESNRPIFVMRKITRSRWLLQLTKP